MHAEEKILIVDDFEELRWLTREILRGGGFETAEAGDGIQALEILRDNYKPALIVLDWNMPKMDGREFLAELRSDPNLSAIPVVILSSELDLPKFASEARADGYVHKTDCGQDLLVTVKKVLAR